MMYVSCAMIPKKVIDLRKRLGQVGIATPVNNVQPLASMGMVEVQTIFPDRIEGIGGVHRRDENQK